MDVIKERRYYVNSNLLRAEMVKCGVTQKDLARLIGMSENSMTNKLSGKRCFTLDEATKIINVLHIENPAEIFLR